MKKSADGSIFRGFSHVLAAVFNNPYRFHRTWDSYVPAKTSADDIAGRWQGEWLSDVNGHRGELRGIFTRKSPERYEAAFRATYSKFLRVCYSVDLAVKEEAGGLKLIGAADLGGLAGGIYTYTGEATAADFQCAYSCKYDHGNFKMTRLD